MSKSLGRWSGPGPDARPWPGTSALPRRGCRPARAEWISPALGAGLAPASWRSAAGMGSVGSPPLPPRGSRASVRRLGLVAAVTCRCSCSRALRSRPWCLLSSSSRAEEATCPSPPWRSSPRPGRDNPLLKVDPGLAIWTRSSSSCCCSCSALRLGDDDRQARRPDRAIRGSIEGSPGRAAWRRRSSSSTEALLDQTRREGAMLQGGPAGSRPSSGSVSSSRRREEYERIVERGREQLDQESARRLPSAEGGGRPRGRVAGA